MKQTICALYHRQNSNYMLLSTITRQQAEQQCATMRPQSYSKFYWHRRYQYRKTLHSKQPLFDKIKNGDYELSDYYHQAAIEDYLLEDKLKQLKTKDDTWDTISLAKKRRAKLLEDFHKDENDILTDMASDFSRTFGLSVDFIKQQMETFDGTTIEFYQHIKDNYSNNQYL
jgi:hypothetical protein